MTTSISRIDLSKQFENMSSRVAGHEALERVLAMLDSVDVIEVDFHGRSPTPSFADECIGGLAKRIGFSEFRRRVKIRNAPDDSIPLLRHVIAKSFPAHQG